MLICSVWMFYCTIAYMYLRLIWLNWLCIPNRLVFVYGVNLHLNLKFLGVRERRENIILFDHYIFFLCVCERACRMFIYFFTYLTVYHLLKQSFLSCFSSKSMFKYSGLGRIEVNIAITFTLSLWQQRKTWGIWRNIYQADKLEAKTS